MGVEATPVVSATTVAGHHQHPRPVEFLCVSFGSSSIAPGNILCHRLLPEHKNSFVASTKEKKQIIITHKVATAAARLTTAIVLHLAE